MTSDRFVLGSDIGTGSSKTALLTADGRVLASAGHGYPTQRPHPGWAEQDPASWHHAFCQTTRQVLADSGVQAGDLLLLGGIRFVELYDLLRLTGPAQGIAAVTLAGIAPTAAVKNDFDGLVGCVTGQR